MRLSGVPMQSTEWKDAENVVEQEDSTASYI
jgi:hypothetical protein